MPAPAVLVRSLADARAALEAAAETGGVVRLESAPEAAAAGGPAWFAALVRAAAEEVPGARFEAVLDCGDAAGHAMAGLRAGLGIVRFTGRADVRRRLAGIAAKEGARIEGARRARALDLDAVPARDRAAVLRRWLERR